MGSRSCISEKCDFEDQLTRVSVRASIFTNGALSPTSHSWENSPWAANTGFRLQFLRGCTVQVPRDQEHGIAHVHTRSTRAADTESKFTRVTGSGERARIRIHHSHKKPVYPGHPIKSYNSQIQAFLHFINLSHSSSAEVLTRELIGTCARCRKFKNVTVGPRFRHPNVRSGWAESEAISGYIPI